MRRRLWITFSVVVALGWYAVVREERLRTFRDQSTHLLLARTNPGKSSKIAEELRESEAKLGKVEDVKLLAEGIDLGLQVVHARFRVRRNGKEYHEQVLGMLEPNSHYVFGPWNGKP